MGAVVAEGVRRMAARRWGGGVERSSPQHTPGVHPSGVAAPSVSTGHWCRTPWCVVIGLTLG